MTDDAAKQLQTALALHRQGRLDDAAALYGQLIARNPKNYQALHYLGIVRAAGGKLAEARTLMERSLAGPAPNITFLENYASVLCQLDDYEAVLAACAQGLQIERANAGLRYVNAVALYKLRRPQEALAQFDAVLAAEPNHLAAIVERGSVFAELKRYEEALAAVAQALKREPGYADAHLNRGNIFFELKRYPEAAAEFDRALALNAGLAEAWLGRGNLASALMRPDEALAAYDRALALKPDLVGAWLGRGNACALLEQYDNAFAAYDRALALKPDQAEAWQGRGNCFAELKQYDKVLAAYDKALALKPDIKFLAGARLYIKLRLADWTNIEAEIAHLLSAARQGKLVSHPFPLLAIPSLPADQWQCAKGYIADRPAFPALWRGERYAHERIRIAYLSADLRDHAVGYLTAGLFELHDQSRFETFAISFSPDRDSVLRPRIKAAFEHFIDVSSQSDEEVAALLRRHEIDIAVDVMGLTHDNRSAVLARRPAPVQVNFLGYPGTMGADYIDYIVADRTIIPRGEFGCYSEQVVWLPDCYQVNDRQRKISDRTPSRRECALPEHGLVFCCFNNIYKIRPAQFDSWMRLLHANETSVLCLLETDPLATANLRREAQRRGIAAERLVFAAIMPLPEHLARLRLADLFLDTLPYNAHTTASDALWAGVPVLTCLGSTFTGRVAGSLLKAAGLDELITHSLQDYEALALKLTREPALLASLKDKLARNRLTCPLFDTERFTRHIEAAYTTMWESAQHGEPPRAFAVTPMG